MSRSDGKRHRKALAKVAVDQLEIAAPHASGRALDQALVRAEVGYGYPLEPQGLLVSVHPCRSHLHDVLLPNEAMTMRLSRSRVRARNLREVISLENCCDTYA